MFLFSRWYSEVYFGDFWVVYTQSKVVSEKYGPISLTIEESASVYAVTIQLFQLTLLDQSLKPTRQDRRGIWDLNKQL